MNTNVEVMRLRGELMRHRHILTRYVEELIPHFERMCKDIQRCTERALRSGRAVKLEADALIEECMLVLKPGKKSRQVLALRTFNAETLTDSLKSHAGGLVEIAGKLDGLVSSVAQIVTCEMQDENEEDEEGDDD